MAYRVLLDKDQSARRTGAVSQPSCAFASPVEAEFARDELWLAKSRDWTTKQFLGQMIQWNEHAKRQEIPEPHCAGKRALICDDTWQALHQAFAGFGREDSWDALVATTALFRRLAVETATALGFAYLVDFDKNISGVLHRLQQAQEKPL